MIINISEIRKKKVKAQRIEFNNDKDYYIIKAYDNYDRAKEKNLKERLVKEYEK